jgi:hypothetical protein
MSYKHLIAVAAAAVLMIILASAVCMSTDTANVVAILKPTAAVTLAMAAQTESLAFTIREFCRAHGISPPTYYELKRQGLGPAEMRMGAVIRISREAAAAWRHARENPSEAEAEASALSAQALRDRARGAAKRSIASPRHVSRREIA